LCRVATSIRSSSRNRFQSLRFVGSGALSAISDRAGHRIDITRNADGAAAAITHSGGYQVSVDTTDGLITALRVGDVPVKRFGYDDQRRLVEVINASGQPLRFAYDAEAGSSNGSTATRCGTLHYDSAGRCTLAEGMNGQLNCTIEYDLDNLVTHRDRLHSAMQPATTSRGKAGCRDRGPARWANYLGVGSVRPPALPNRPSRAHTRFNYSETGDLRG